MQKLWDWLKIKLPFLASKPEAEPTVRLILHASLAKRLEKMKAGRNDDWVSVVQDALKFYIWYRQEYFDQDKNFYTYENGKYIEVDLSTFFNRISSEEKEAYDRFLSELLPKRDDKAT